MKLRVLGCGTSSGVPRIGNDWGRCSPDEPRNRRTRSALLVESGSERLLVDCGPDLREQLLAADTSTLDRVIVTHDHADHLHGIDDLRQVALVMGRPVRLAARATTLDRIVDRFRYAFAGSPLYPAVLTAEILAEEDTAAMLVEAVGQGGVTGVLHCFTSSADLARTALDIGFFISLSGIVTFKNARDLQEVAKFVPADRLLVETDSPFLAPVPNRGKTCEPAFVTDTAAFVAKLRDEPIEQLAASTTANFFSLFGKAAA